MKSLEIKEAIKRIKRDRTISKESEFYLKKDIEIVLKYFEKIKKENPDISEEEMQQIFTNEQYATLVRFSKAANIRGKFFQYRACQKLLKDKKKIAQIYDEVKDTYEDYQEDIYNANEENCLKVLVKEMIYVLKNRNIDDETRRFGEMYKNASSKVKKEMESSLTSDQRKILQELVSTTSDDDVQNIYNLLISLSPSFEEGIKEDLIIAMEEMGKFFERFDLIQKYKRQNTSMLLGLGLSKLDQPLCKDKFGKTEIEIRELFSKEFLEQYDVEDLLVLNAFWQNRFAKETESINHAAFAIKELGLTEQRDLDSIYADDVELVYTKNRFLRDVSDILSVKIRGLTKNKEKMKEEGWEEVDSKGLVEAVLKPFTQEYEEAIYQKTGRRGNDIVQDYYEYAVLHNQLQNSYICKDSMLINILDMVYDKNSKVHNWGYMQHEIVDGEKVDTLQGNSKFVLLGLDYEGMNMPVRLHMKKDMVVDFLMEHTGTTILPIYDGEQDFMRNGRNVSTPILMPVSNKYKKVIKTCLEERKKDTQSTNFLEHLLYIKDNSKYPPHLKVKKQEKGTLVDVIPDRRYIDIKTGEKMIKSKEGYQVIGGKTNEDGR